MPHKGGIAATSYAFTNAANCSACALGTNYKENVFLHVACFFIGY